MVLRESNAHKELKNIAKQILFNEGFNKNEIFFEYSYHYKVSEVSRPFWARSDVAGISKRKKIAVECGTLSSDTRKLFNTPFDKIIILPYLDTDLKEVKSIPNVEILKPPKINKTRKFRATKKPKDKKPLLSEASQKKLEASTKEIKNFNLMTIRRKTVNRSYKILKKYKNTTRGVNYLRKIFAAYRLYRFDPFLLDYFAKRNGINKRTLERWIGEVLLLIENKEVDFSEAS